MRLKTNTVAQLNFLADNRVWADVTVTPNPRARANDCRLMNEGF
jgi:hypothetical protein